MNEGKQKALLPSRMPNSKCRMVDSFLASSPHCIVAKNTEPESNLEKISDKSKLAHILQKHQVQERLEHRKAVELFHIKVYQKDMTTRCHIWSGVQTWTTERGIIIKTLLGKGMKFECEFFKF